MTDIAAAPHSLHAPLTLSERAMNYTAWGIGIGLFATVGWMALRPDDPQGAVGLTTRNNPAIMLVQVLGLTAVVSAAATIIVGRRIPDAGAFAAALGLAVANLRGNTAAYMLVHTGGGVNDVRSLFATYVGEGFVWFAAMLTAMIVAGLIMRWCLGVPALPAGPDHLITCGTLAAADLPLIKRWMTPPSPADRPMARGLMTTAVTVVLALLGLLLIAAGDPARAVRHGQVYFSLFVAFYVATMLAYEVAPACTAWWSLLAPPLTCACGYVWTMFRLGAPASAHLASVPPTPYARATPLEYVAVGSVAVLAAFWAIRRNTAARAAAHASAASTKGKR